MTTMMSPEARRKAKAKPIAEMTEAEVRAYARRLEDRLSRALAQWRRYRADDGARFRATAAKQAKTRAAKKAARHSSVSTDGG